MFQWLRVYRSTAMGTWYVGGNKHIFFCLFVFNKHILKGDNLVDL